MSDPTSFTDEASNVFSYAGLSYETDTRDTFTCTKEESFVEILMEKQISIIFTREYEHKLGIISTTRSGKLKTSYFVLPHPSGIAVDGNGFYVISTRTPHMLFRFVLDRKYDAASEDDFYFRPRFSRFLSGSLYAHEIATGNHALYINATGWNEIEMIDKSLTGELKAFKPSIYGKKHNTMQINSLGMEAGVPRYATCFSPKESDMKPWKDKVGPINKGALMRISDWTKIIDGLTCPHSVRVVNSELFYCNSGCGEVRRCDLNGYQDECIAKLPGFTRGLAICDDYIFVGLSKVIKGRESYAPGIDCCEAECAIYILSKFDGSIISRLVWPNGQQIFDIQAFSTIGTSHSIRFATSRKRDDLEPSADFFE